MRTFISLLWLLQLSSRILAEEGLNSTESTTTTTTITTSTSIPTSSDSIDHLKTLDQAFIELGLELLPVVALDNTTTSIVSNLLNETETEQQQSTLTTNDTESTLSSSYSSASHAPITSSNLSSIPSPIPSDVADEIPTQLDNSTLDSIPIVEVAETTTIPVEIPSPPELLSFNEWREKYVPPSDPLARRIKKIRPKNEDGTVIENNAAGVGINEEGKEESMSGGITGEEVVGETDGNVKEVTKVDAQASEVEGSTNQKGTTESTEGSSPIQPLPNVGTGDSSDPLVALKDRSNYALYECSATVHRSSKESKGAASILVEKKDRYMLTPCSANPQFVELELCDEIRIDTVALANFEFFSSMFKHFSIKVSVNYPGRVDEWHDLGTFRARNARGVQVFNTKALPTFYRYMRIDFLSHYGSEYFCPVSLLRVYGITQMDSFRREDEKMRAIEAELAEQMSKEEEYEDTIESVQVVEEVPIISSSSIVETIISTSQEEENPIVTASEIEESTTTTSTLIEVISTPAPTSTLVSEEIIEEPTVARPSISSTISDIPPIPSSSSSPPATHSDNISSESVYSESPVLTSTSTIPISALESETTSKTPLATPTASEPPPTPAPTSSKELTIEVIVTVNDTEVATSLPPPHSPASTSTEISSSSTSSEEENSSSSVLASSSTSPSANSISVATSTSIDNTTSTSTISSSSPITAKEETITSSSSSSTSIPEPPVTPPYSSPTSTETLSTSNSTTIIAASLSSSKSISANTTSSPSTSRSSSASIPPSPSPSSTLSNRTETATTRTPPSPPPPLTPPPNTHQQPGESIYGTIMKRLTSLEHNQTLSMHFMEMQSEVLRDSFLRVEKRLVEIENGRNKQDMLIKESYAEMERHRIELEKDRSELTSRVNLLAQELLSERRIGVAQLIGLFLLFVFVGLTRGSTAIPLKVVQRSVSRRSHIKYESDHTTEDDHTNRDVTLSSFKQRISRSDSTGSLESARKAARFSSLPITHRGSVTKRLPSVPRRHYSVAAPSKLSKSIRDWNPAGRQSSAPPEDIFSFPFSPSNTNPPTTSSRSAGGDNFASPRRRLSRQHRSEGNSSPFNHTISGSSKLGTGKISPGTPARDLPPINGGDGEWTTGDESTNSNSKSEDWDDAEDVFITSPLIGSPVPLARLPVAPPEISEKVKGEREE